MKQFEDSSIIFLILLQFILGAWIFSFSTPILFHSSSYYTSTIFVPAKLAFHNICHQQQNKCFTLDKASFLVCARCMGIYVGIFMAFPIFYIFTLFFTCNQNRNTSYFDFIKVKIGNKFLALIELLAISFPIALHVMLINLKIVEYDKITALITGIITGFSFFLYILRFVFPNIFELKKGRG